MIKSALMIVFLFSSQSFARSVDIAIAKDQEVLTLSNPSTVAVNYDIICHKADGSGTILNSTNQTLAVNAKANLNVAIGDSGKCAGGVTPYETHTDYAGKKFYVCQQGTATYANANSLCGTGNSFCMPKTRYTSCSDYINSCASGPVWVKTESPTEFRPDTCTAWGVETTNGVVIRHDYTGSGNVRQSSSEGNSYFSYSELQAKSGTFGAVCCQGGEYSSYCRITINNTGSEARLISPSFKNGAAF